ncbi:hypothetical protein [Pseudoalteromonas fuliginea]|uniref:hypothetical protein n=1 Tax=Pseudoalteromonas fuliginea TaxID=1872678 RepID=UPI003180DE7A
MNKISVSNICLVIISCFLLIKTSEAPYWFGYSIGILDNFSYGNLEVFSVAASVLAAYIFYAVNILIPNYINRKKSLSIIDAQLTQVVYRCMCLLYIYNECSKYLSEQTMKKLYKILAYDLSKKISLIDALSENLTIDERGALNKIRASKDKFFMSDRNLDVSAKKINDAAVYLVKSIKLPSAHCKDEDWFQIKDGSISFIQNTNTFKLFLVELEQLDKSEASKLPDVKWFQESLIKDAIKNLQVIG